MQVALRGSSCGQRATFWTFLRGGFCVCKTRHFGKKLGVALQSAFAVKVHGSLTYDHLVGYFPPRLIGIELPRLSNLGLCPKALQTRLSQRRAVAELDIPSAASRLVISRSRIASTSSIKSLSPLSVFSPGRGDI
jgi:hypothetical protein